MFRKFIDNYNRKNWKCSSTYAPVYSICDASDKKQTIIIGASQTADKLMRTLVFIIGCLPICHKVMSVEYMRSKHIANIRATNPRVSNTQSLGKC